MLTIRISFLLILFTGTLCFADIRETLNKFQDSVHYAELNNGIKIIFYKRSFSPVFSANISVRVGGVNEISGQTGISHMLEHMAFKGTKTLGTKNYLAEAKLLARLEKIMQEADAGNQLSVDQKQEVAEISMELEKYRDLTNTFEKIYQELGATDINATTSSDLTNYFVSLPNTAFNAWCEIESDRLTEPVWREFYREREVVQEERRMRYEDSPDGIFYQKMLLNAFEVHPYRNPTIGYIEDLRRHTATEIDRYYRDFYVGDNIVISIVGDLEFEQVLDKVKKYFSRISAKSAPERPKVKEPEQKGEKTFIFYTNAAPSLMVAYHKPNYPNPKDLALNVWLEMMAGNRTAPLYRELVLSKKIASGIGYFEAPGTAYPNLYILNATPQKNHSNKELLVEIDRILMREIENGVQKEKLQNVKQKMMVDYITGLQSNLSLAQQLSYAQQNFGSWKLAFSWIDEMEDLTTDKINAVVKEYIKNDNRVVGYRERSK